MTNSDDRGPTLVRFFVVSAIVLVSPCNLVQNGTIEANGDIGLSGQIITGTGALLSDGSISFTAGNGGIDYAGNINAKIGLNFTAPTHIRLAGTVNTDGIASIDTGTLTIDGALSAFGGLNFTNVNALNIGSGGSLVSDADLSLHFIDFNNSGILASNKALAIDVDGQGTNSGSLLAGTGLRINVGGEFSNSGTVSSGEAPMHQAVSLSAKTRGSGRERIRRSQLPHSPTPLWPDSLRPNPRTLRG